MDEHGDKMFAHGFTAGCAAIFTALQEMEKPVRMLCRTRLTYCQERNGGPHITLDLDPATDDELRKVLEVLDESPTLVRVAPDIEVLRWAHPLGVYSMVAYSDRLQVLRDLTA